MKERKNHKKHQVFMNIFISTQCLCSKFLIILEAYMEEIIQEFARLQKNKTKIFSVTKCELSSVRPCCTCYPQPLKYIFDPLGKSERTAKCLVSRRAYGVGCIY